MDKFRVSVIVVTVLLLLWAALAWPSQRAVSAAAACGTMTSDSGTGFPLLNTDNCVPDNATPPVRKAWKPLMINPTSVCVDWILYHTNQAGSWNIYRLGELPDQPKADANLTKGKGKGIVDMSPSLSPDGQWLAFTSNRTGNWELYVASNDGTTQARSTYTTTAANLAPMWSPDGKYIAYESTLMGGHNIYLFDVTKGTSTRLTTDSGNDINPFWSPDSSKIVFQSDRSGTAQWQVYVFDLTSKSDMLLSDGNGIDVDPQYSPDGKLIAFRSYRGGVLSAIYTMNANGAAVQRISDPAGNALNQAWSPDSTLIAYQSNLDGDDDIYVYQVTTGKSRHVTDNTVADYAPTWRCNADTSFIVFTSEITGTPAIYQTSALPLNNRGVKPEDINQLTFDKGKDMFPENAPAVESASHQTGITPPTAK
jgi:Tol biopolymer transport system component